MPSVLAIAAHRPARGCVRRVVQTSVGQGWTGEAGMRLLMPWRIPAAHYLRFDEVILPSADGSSQIDRILLSRLGVFVIETRIMAGRIVGDDHQAMDTAAVALALPFFENPLRQNDRLLKAAQLGWRWRTRTCTWRWTSSATARSRQRCQPMSPRAGGSHLHPRFQNSGIHAGGRRCAVRTSAAGTPGTRQGDTPAAPGPPAATPRHAGAAAVSTLRAGAGAVHRQQGRPPGKRFRGCPTYPRCRTRLAL